MKDGKSMEHGAGGMEGAESIAWTDAQVAHAVGMLEHLDKWGEDEFEDCVPASMKDLRNAMRRLLRNGVPFSSGMKGPRVSFADWTVRVRDAFGATGDWGYDSPLGKLLHGIYKAGAEARCAEGVKA